MFRSISTRAARVVAIGGLSAAVVVGLAVPASAAPPSGQNQATDVIATGLFVGGPFAVAQFDAGPATDTVATVEIGPPATPAVTTGVNTVNADGNSADATVANLRVQFNPIVGFEPNGNAGVTAAAASSECSYDPATGSLTGSTSFVDGRIVTRGDDGPLPPLVPAPAPNTTVNINTTSTTVAAITLNRQTNNPDGSLTVDAIFIELVGVTQTITIATSSCQPAVLAIPVIAPAFAVSTGVFALLGVGFFLYRRRQNALDVA